MMKTNIVVHIRLRSSNCLRIPVIKGSGPPIINIRLSLKFLFSYHDFSLYVCRNYDGRIYSIEE